MSAEDSGELLGQRDSVAAGAKLKGAALQLKDSSADFEEFPHFFHLQLELFDGPIDLLLHLVKANELPIEKLSLAEVTSQYMSCLDQMKDFDLEVAGEYLVIAATLLSIKSSILLGRPVELVEDPSGQVFDPHEELLRRLREAEVYREGAKQLHGRALLGRDVFSAPLLTLKKIPKGPETFCDHDPVILGKAFRKILAEAGELEDDSYAITLDSVSIVDRMMQVLDQLNRSEDGVEFERLIPDRTRKAEIIGTFIALLELCKRQAIRVNQEDKSETIMIRLAASSDLSLGSANANIRLESEFDQSPGEVDSDQEQSAGDSVGSDGDETVNA